MIDNEIFEKQDKFIEELKTNYPLLYKDRIWIEYGSGWYDLIRNLSKEIYELYNKWGSKYNEVPFVVQMKEKFGGLRYYMSFSEMSEEDYKTLREIVDRYESMSFNVCEACSAPGKNGTTGKSYWYRTLCESCRELQLKKQEETYAAYTSNKI